MGIYYEKLNFFASLFHLPQNYYIIGIYIFNDDLYFLYHILIQKIGKDLSLVIFVGTLNKRSILR